MLPLPCCLALAAIAAQTPSGRPASSLTVLSATERRSLPTTREGGYEMVALDELAPLFQLSVRDAATAGGVTVSYHGRTIALTPGQNVALVAGRLVSLPAPVVREGRRWFVPIEFISRAVAPIYDTRLELRTASRLVILGDLRVPRVAVSVETAGTGVRVSVGITPRTGHVVTEEPGRLLIRFDSDVLDLSLPPSVPQDIVRGVRVVDPANLLAVDLGPRVGVSVTSRLPDQAGGERLLIDLDVRPAEPVLPGQVAAPPPARTPPPPALAGASRATLVIDPGHGGDDAGARGPGGELEKDVTLAVARQLKSAIEGRLGVRVLLTRDGDVTVPLEDRTALANNNKAELFLSVHANVSLRPSVRGAVVSVLSAEGAEGPQASSAERVPAVGGLSRAIDVIAWDTAQMRFLAESSTFADIVGQELQSRVPIAPRRIEQAPFRVLVGANMPAVLVEIGFLSNPEEAQQLVSPAYQSLIVQGLAESVTRFRTYLDQMRGPLAPAVPPLGPAGGVWR